MIVTLGNYLDQGWSSEGLLSIVNGEAKWTPQERQMVL